MQSVIESCGCRKCISNDYGTCLTVIDLDSNGLCTGFEDKEIIELKDQIDHLIELGNALVHNVECSCIEKEGVFMSCVPCNAAARWETEVAMIEEEE